MQLQAPGTRLAVGLGALALVVAGTGTATAVAVAATQVNIVDATNAARVARVDGFGRLQTGGAVSTINTATFVGYGTNALTSPTTAQLAVTLVGYFNTNRNTAYPNTNVNVSLVKINVGSSGTCYDTDASVVTQYSRTRVAVGQKVTDVYAAPLLVKPSGTTPYCIGAVVANDDSGTVPSSYYNPYLQLAAYSTSGSYTGTGVAGRPGPVPPAAALTTPDDPSPAGVGVR